MTPFRQYIYPNDKGGDVFAVKRALRVLKEDHGMIKLDYFAGAGFIDVIQRIQEKNKLTADGIYGKKTHELISPHFDQYGIWLYRHASIRHHMKHYFNPFANAVIVPGRIDMGVDYHGTGRIDAIGECEVIGNGGNGWPGREFLLYRLLHGPFAHRFIYMAEAIIPLVRAGQRVKGGKPIALFRWDSAPGIYPGIEIGWGTRTLNLTYAAASGQSGGQDHSNSPAGLAFARFLRAIGAEISASPGEGPMFPH